MTGATGKLQGCYKNSSLEAREPGFLRVEEDGKVSWREGGREPVDLKLEYGEFKPAEEVLREASGIEKYNLQLWILDKKTGKAVYSLGFGIVSADGEKCYVLDNKGTGVDIFIKITEDQATQIEEDLGDPICAPPGPYTLQPQVRGKLIWLTGAPGMGKSSTAQLLGREKGFVYYEMDCFGQLRNPFIPLDVEDPTLYQEYQRNLTGEGREERTTVVKAGGKAFEKIWKFWKWLKKEDYEAIENFYELLCKDISSQRARIGGDWVVAGVVIQKHQRDIIRKLLGPEVVIVILSMPKKDVKKRLKKRHPKKEEKKLIDWLMLVGDANEKIRKEEENVVTVEMTEEMTREEIMELVYQTVDQELPIKENITSNFCHIL